MIKINSSSTENTILVGKRIGKLLKAGDVLLLTGDLGADSYC